MAFAQTLELFSPKRGTYTSGPDESITAYRLLRKGMRLISLLVLKRPLYGAVAGLALMSACAASPQADNRGVTAGTGMGTADPTPRVTVPSLPPFTSSGNATMDAWRLDFADRAMAAGRDPIVVYDTLSEISPLDLYLSDDASVAKTGIADQLSYCGIVDTYTNQPRFYILAGSFFIILKPT